MQLCHAFTWRYPQPQSSTGVVNDRLLSCLYCAALALRVFCSKPCHATPPTLTSHATAAPCSAGTVTWGYLHSQAPLPCLHCATVPPPPCNAMHPVSCREFCGVTLIAIAHRLHTIIDYNKVRVQQSLNTKGAYLDRADVRCARKEALRREKHKRGGSHRRGGESHPRGRAIQGGEPPAHHLVACKAVGTSQIGCGCIDCPHPFTALPPTTAKVLVPCTLTPCCPSVLIRHHFSSLAPRLPPHTHCSAYFTSCQPLTPQDSATTAMQVLVLEGGRVAEFAPPAELLQKPGGIFAGLVADTGELKDLLIVGLLFFP